MPSIVLFLTGARNANKQRSNGNYHDETLPNELYGERTRRDTKYQHSAKYRDHSYIKEDKPNRHTLHYNREDFKPPGEVATRRHRQLGSNTELTKIPSQYAMHGGPQNINHPTLQYII